MPLLRGAVMRIVVTHGRAQAYEIPGSLERLWEDALRHGLQAVGVPEDAQPAIDFAFYGDIWRPDRRGLREASRDDEGGGDGERGSDVIDREPSLRRRPSELQAGVASELLPRDRDVERLDWNRLAGVIRDLDRVLGVGKVILTWFLKDLDEYFRDAAIRAQVLDRLRLALPGDGEPVLLLGHSMGSIVAYDLLAADGARARGVSGLVTFGSPLGMASVHARVAALHPGTPFPGGLDAWANVFNEQDFATVVRFLSPLFPAQHGAGILDLASLGRPPTALDMGRGHDPIIYLSSVGLATAVRDLLERGRAVRANGGGGTSAPEPALEPSVPLPGAGPEATGGPPVRSRGLGDAVRGSRGWARSAPPSRNGEPVDGGPVDADRGAGVRVDADRGSGEPVDADRGAGGRRRASTRRSARPSRSAPVASPETPAEATGLRTVERTASADFPPIVAPGSKHELRVAISGKAVHARHTDPIAIEAPVDQRELPLRVGVYAADFAVAAASDPSRTWEEVSVDLDDAAAVAEARFRLTASRRKERRQSVIYVTIYRGNLPVGQLSLVTVIDPVKDVRAIPLALGTPSAPDPDFVLVVTDRSQGVKGEGPFDISVSKEGEFLNKPLGSFPVTVDAWNYARDRLEGFRSVREEPTPDDRVRAAEALGLDIWWDLPESFRTFYWEELHGRDVSIAIYSQEPYIPWELIRPQRARAGEEADFLGVAFRIARWRQALRFPDPLDVTGFAVIAPVYEAGSGSQPLPGAQLEAQELIDGFGARLLGGDRRAVREFLEKGSGVQLIHFAGHGEFDPDAKDDTIIKLSDAALVPQDIHRAKLGVAAHPFVVLNACEVGEEGWSLTRIGGWAQAFTDVGFSGFVGPYWAVNDRIARKVAMQFYGSLTRGLTVGEAIREIRRSFYSDPEDRGHPSWLAYTLHCQPNVHVRMPPNAGREAGTVAAREQG